MIEALAILFMPLAVAGLFLGRRRRQRIAANPCRYNKHPWPKWSTAVQSRATATSWTGGRVGITVWAQDRTCPVCGQYERRLLGEDGSEL